jgi:hypothetical protein
MDTTTTPTTLTKSFIATHVWHKEEQEWIKAVFGAIMTVAKKQREFTVDAIWEQISILKDKKKLPKSNIDHRVLGPMIRHMVSDGLLRSSGYYTKSTRAGGGSRPVTIWTSFIYSKAKAA